MKSILFLLCCALFMSACAALPQEETRPTALPEFSPKQTPQDAPQGERYLDAITERQSDLINFAGFELAGADSIRLMDGANPYIGLRVYPNQPFVNDGKRAEVSFNFPFSQGDTIVYEWKAMIPSVFPASDVPDSRWWSISQWHDQPNVNLGETWDDFPAHPPAIALEYETLEGQDYLGFYYGTFATERAGLIPFTRGEWLDIRIEIHWSQGEDGSAKLYLNGGDTPLFFVQGANMFNDYQHYFKIGQYRDPKINTDNTVYFDDVRIYKK